MGDKGKGKGGGKTKKAPKGDKDLRRPHEIRRAQEGAKEAQAGR